MSFTAQQAVSIQTATPNDLPAILALLEQNSLPTAGLIDAAPVILTATKDGAIVGCAAIEMYGTSALLRSVVVQKGLQRLGLGTQLTQAALSYASEHGITDIYLLTETAGDFFPRFGFRPTTRADVPATVAQSVEFTSACPQSALVMHRHHHPEK